MDYKKWFMETYDVFNPYKPNTIESLVCYEIGQYYAGCITSIEDGFSEKLPSKDCLVEVAYQEYVNYKPRGHRYQGKAKMISECEKIVEGLLEAWGTDF